LFIFLAFGFVQTTNAQLSERDNNPSVIKSGTRPVQGNFGLFIGPRFTEISEMLDENIDVRGLPLVNVKYFVTDNIEGRFGIQYYKTRQVFDGSLSEGELMEQTLDNSSRNTTFTNLYISDYFVGSV